MATSSQMTTTEQDRGTTPAPIETKTPTNGRDMMPAAESAVANLGKTLIIDDVVSAVARMAAEEVEGVHQIGVAGFRGMLSRIGGNSGVESEVGVKEAAISLDIIVEYGYPMVKIADALRKHVIESVEFMTGRRVVAVDVTIAAVKIPKPQKPKTRILE